MWRHMLMFLLVNTYGLSLGTPVINQVSIPILFSNLAKGCKNEFVTAQIGVKTKDCNVTTPPLQFRCLVFYDASSLLCNISSYPNIATDFTIKTSEKYNVSSFCSQAAHFNIPSTSNQKLMTQIFQGDVLCKNVCVDEDILTGDTNFVCKYFKWMLEIIQPGSSSSHGNYTVADSSGKPTATELKAMGSEGKSNEVTTPNMNNTSNVVKEPEGDIKVESVKEPNMQLNINAVSGLDRVDHSTEQLGVKIQKTNQTKTVEPNHIEQKVNVIEEPNKHSNSDTGLANDIDHIAEKDPIEKDAVIENPQQGGVDDEENDDAGMDAVGDDNKEDNIDTEGDDREDHIGDVDFKLNNEEKSSSKHIETQMAFNEGSQRDIFPNAMSDAFPEDDDHFFPFFLTVVIVVVVLYILYHNKNKVSKMFFGLIVEGRQPGRRRNSRGHAYRRLDTLEQAMSANTTAPPSKIIY